MTPTLFLIQLSGKRYEAVLLDGDIKFEPKPAHGDIFAIDLDKMEFADSIESLAQSDSTKLFLIPRQYRSRFYKGKSFASVLGAPEAVYTNCKEIPEIIIRKIAATMFKQRNPIRAANICLYNLRNNDLAKFVLSSEALQNPAKAIEAILGEDKAEKRAEKKVPVYKSKKTLMNLVSAIIEHKVMVNPSKTVALTYRKKAKTTDWNGEQVDVLYSKLYPVTVTPNRSRANLSLTYVADAVLTEPDNQKHVVKVFRNITLIRDGKLNVATLVTSKELLPYLKENGYVYIEHENDVRIPLAGIDIVSQDDLKPNDFEGLKNVYLDTYMLKAQLEVIKFILAERVQDMPQNPSPYIGLANYGVNSYGFYEPKIEPNIPEELTQDCPEVPGLKLSVEGYATMPTASVVRDCLKRTPKMPGMKLIHSLYEELKAENTVQLLKWKKDRHYYFNLRYLELCKCVMEILLCNNLATAAMTEVKPKTFKANNGLTVKFITLKEQIVEARKD